MEDAQFRHNSRHLYADIFWFGLLSGSTLAFLTVYAARLGASGFQISLLTAGPALVNLLVSIPAGRWLQNKNFIRVSFWTAAMQRLGYGLLVFFPWLFNQPQQIDAMIVATLVMSLPATILAISFNALFADVIPPEHRAEVVGKRNALLAVSLSGSTLLSGQILDRITFPLNYQIVFLAGALGALLSTYHLGRLRRGAGGPPVRIGQLIGDAARFGLRIGDALQRPVGLRFLTRAQGASLLRLDLLRGRFGLFMLAYWLFYSFQYLAVPIFPLAYVHHLRLSDWEIGLGSALFYLVMLLVSLRLKWLSARFSHRMLLVASATVFGIYPLLLAIAWDATLYWAASFFGGGVYAVVSASLINRLMEFAPESGRPGYMALHNLAFNLGILAGSLAGPMLSAQIGLVEVLILTAVLRGFAGLVLFLWG